MLQDPNSLMGLLTQYLRAVGWSVAAAVGFAFVFTSNAIGHIFESAPAPLTMLILLMGLLMLLTSTYAWLVFEGPLADEEE